MQNHLAEELVIVGVSLLAEFGVGPSGLKGWDETGQFIRREVVAQLECLCLQNLWRVVPDFFEVRLTQLKVNCELENRVGKQSEKMPRLTHVLKGSPDGDQSERHRFWYV